MVLPPSHKNTFLSLSYNGQDICEMEKQLTKRKRTKRTKTHSLTREADLTPSLCGW